MAAGLGFKTFTTGEVLTAADTNGYLMQGVLVFASAAARDAAITSPQEGQFAYLKDTNVTTYYTGSAWTNLDTTGMVNPMTTTGDMVYSSSGSTPARLGIGTTGQVVTVAGGIPSWATPASGSLTKISTTTWSGAATVNISPVFSATYRRYRVLLSYKSTLNSDYYIKMSASGTNSSSDYYYSSLGWLFSGSANNAQGNGVTTGFAIPKGGVNATMQTVSADVFFPFEAAATEWNWSGISIDHGYGAQGTAGHNSATSYNGFSLVFASGNSTGECVVYGYQD